MNESGFTGDELIFRHVYGRLVARLTARFGANRLELVEDAVQEALLNAVETWGRKQTPEKPEAWLYKVAQNRILDRLRQVKRRKESSFIDETEDFDEAQLLTAFADSTVHAKPNSSSEEFLSMLERCCDDALPAKSQWVVALKLLCGFSTKEIAQRLFISEENVQKRLERGRSHLDNSSKNEPAADGSTTSDPSHLLHTLYLLFLEGFHSTAIDTPIQRELAEEALRLVTMLCDDPKRSHGDAWALQALLRFHWARIDSRVQNGQILLLEEQDRSLWRRDQIQLAYLCLYRSSTDPKRGRYHIEAAIAAEHCAAPDLSATRWADIVQYYIALERIAPSPYNLIGQAIALSYAEGIEVALKFLREQRPPSWLNGFHYWEASFAQIIERSADPSQALEHWERAAELCPYEREKKFYQTRAQKLRPPQ